MYQILHKITALIIYWQQCIVNIVYLLTKKPIVFHNRPYMDSLSLFFINRIIRTCATDNGLSIFVRASFIGNVIIIAKGSYSNHFI